MDKNSLRRGLHQSHFSELPEHSGNHFPHRADSISELLLADRREQDGTLLVTTGEVEQIRATRWLAVPKVVAMTSKYT